MLFRLPVRVWPLDGTFSLFLLLSLACWWWVHSLCELPTRNALARWLGIHIVNRLSVHPFLLILWLSLGYESFGERVFVNVVLIVQFWHRETANPLRPILVDMAVVCISGLLKTLIVLHKWVTVFYGALQYLIALIYALYVLSRRLRNVVECRHVNCMLLCFNWLSSAAWSSLVALNNLVSSHHKVHLVCFRLA